MSRKPLAIIFIGKPGSGKSTIAKELAGQSGSKYISSGDIARYLSDGNQILEHRLKMGVMFPESDMRSAMDTIITQNASERIDIVIDGMPRFVGQYRWLDRRLFELDYAPVYIIAECPDGICVDRLLSRGRDDDNIESVSKRMEYFKVHTIPMVKIITKNDALHIDINTDDCIPHIMAEYVAHEVISTMEFKYLEDNKDADNR